MLGVAPAKVRFGGNKGRILSLKAGDVAVLPAGTGHQRLSASDDFLVIGAYPPSGTYDECTTAAAHAKAVVTIPRVGRPRKDPVYGSKGPLLAAWKEIETISLEGACGSLRVETGPLTGTSIRSAPHNID
ncbi:hypothetical protein [Mesorhizobium sp. M0045]|uniref:hypothetical protein n=1 Tax=Mesorhizobium sp. M0045 TaxID=2956857 RepID=UPI003338B0E3